MALASRVSQSTAAAYENHRVYVLSVLNRRCGWLDGGEREEVFHEAYATVLEKQRDGTLDLGQMSQPQIRAFLTQTAIHKALDEGKRAGRKRSVPLADAELTVPDRAPGPEDVAAAGMDSARLREIVGELSERQRAIVKLRFFFDRTPVEIQQYLEISERVYRRELERALRRVLEDYELVRAGTYCEGRRSMIRALVAGIAGPRRAAAAREHIVTCPACAAWAAKLRDATRRAGAVVVLPTFDSHTTQLERLVHLGASIRDALANAAAGLKQHGASAATRADQTFAGYVASARPGTVAMLVAGCVSLGGGVTYCAVEGVPDAFRGLTGAAEAERPAKTQGSRTSTPPAAARPPRATTGQNLASKRPSAPASKEPTARRAVPRSPKQGRASSAAAEREFGFEAPAPSSPVAPAAPAGPAPPAPRGEFDP